MMRSGTRYLTTSVNRDPDRWLYKKIITFVKCFIENRQNSYSNYFEALKCKADYAPEGACHLNKFEKFNIEQTFKLYQFVNKLLTHKSVNQHSGYLQILINEHQKAKKDRKEYTKYVQSLDHGRELKPFNEEPKIINLEKMRKEHETIMRQKRDEELKRKKIEHDANKSVRKLKQQQMQEQLRLKIEADKRSLEAFPSSKGASKTPENKIDK